MEQSQPPSFNGIPIEYGPSLEKLEVKPTKAVVQYNWEHLIKFFHENPAYTINQHHLTRDHCVAIFRLKQKI